MVCVQQYQATVLVKKKGSETHAKAREERVLAKRLRYSRTNAHEVHEMRTTTVAIRMRLGIYTVRELRDNTVANFAIMQSRWICNFVLSRRIATNSQPFFDKYHIST